METTLPQNVVDARTAAQSASNTVGQFNSKGYTIEDELKKVVQESLDYNKDIVEKRSGALADYLKAPADAGVRYGVQQFSQGPQAGQTNQDFVWNPFERNKMIQGSIGNAMIPFSTYNTLLGMREGDVGKLVDAGTRAFQATQSAAQSQAQNARQYYSDVLGEFTTMQDIQARQQQLQQEQQRIDFAKEEAARKAATAGGSGTDSSWIGSALAQLLGQNQEVPQTAPVAQRSPYASYDNPHSQFVTEEQDQPNQVGDFLSGVSNWIGDKYNKYVTYQNLNPLR